MALMEWTDELSLGIKSIDIQHKILVKCINDLHHGMLENCGDQVLSDVLTDLLEYTVMHFDFEEDLLEEHGYPATPEHKQEHIRLCDKVIAFKEQFDAGTVSITDDILEFLKDWLRHHILETDKEYVPHLQGRGL